MSQGGTKKQSQSLTRIEPVTSQTPGKFPIHWAKRTHGEQDYCDCVYISQTSRMLKTHVKEHAKAIATLDKNSVAKHHILHCHQIDLESVEIVDRSSAWQQKLILILHRALELRTTSWSLK